LTRKTIMPMFLLLLFLVPVAQCFTINAPNFNFQATHGGNVRFANQITTAQINRPATLTRFGALTTSGNNRGALSFDCDTGVNMTIISINELTITYNVSTLAPGAVNTYVTYSTNDHVPIGTNTDTVTYNTATHIATVTTTGNGVLVTLNYATVSSLLEPSINILIYFIPLLAMLIGLEAKNHDLINNRLFVYIMLIALLGVLFAALRTMGY